MPVTAATVATTVERRNPTPVTAPPWSAALPGRQAHNRAGTAVERIQRRVGEIATGPAGCPRFLACPLISQEQ